LSGWTRPTIVELPDWAQDPWAGLDPAHISWLLCMSTVTSFASPAETCTVHVLHGEGRNKSKRKGGGGSTWRSLSRQWWRSGSSGDPSSSILYVLLCFSLLLFLSSYFFSVLSPFVLFILSFFFPSFLLLSIPILLLSSFSQFLFFFLFFFSVFSCSLSSSVFFFFCYSSVSLFFFVLFDPLLYSFLFSFSTLLCTFFFVLPPVFIGKNRGRTWLGRPLCCRPTTARGAHSLLFSPPCGRPRVKGYTSGAMVGVFLMLLRERSRWKQRKKQIFFFPCFSRPGEEERLQCRSKRHRFGLLVFFLTVHETAPFHL